MESDKDTVTYICEQMQGAGAITAKPMFGEYGVYCDGRMVALICDNQLFLKPTEGARAILPDAELAPPYPGAKPHILCDDALDDPETLAQAIRAALVDLPTPKPKKPK